VVSVFSSSPNVPPSSVTDGCPPTDPLDTPLSGGALTADLIDPLTTLPSLGKMASRLPRLPRDYTATTMLCTSSVSERLIPPGEYIWSFSGSCSKFTIDGFSLIIGKFWRAYNGLFSSSLSRRRESMDMSLDSPRLCTTSPPVVPPPSDAPFIIFKLCGFSRTLEFLLWSPGAVLPGGSGGSATELF
jgi:hypothetical protein